MAVSQSPFKLVDNLATVQLTGLLGGYSSHTSRVTVNSTQSVSDSPISKHCPEINILEDAVPFLAISAPGISLSVAL